MKDEIITGDVVVYCQMALHPTRERWPDAQLLSFCSIGVCLFPARPITALPLPLLLRHSSARFDSMCGPLSKLSKDHEPTRLLVYHHLVVVACKGDCVRNVHACDVVHSHADEHIRAYVQHEIP